MRLVPLPQVEDFGVAFSFTDDYCLPLAHGVYESLNPQLRALAESYGPLGVPGTREGLEAMVSALQQVQEGTPLTEATDELAQELDEALGASQDCAEGTCDCAWTALDRCAEIADEHLGDLVPAGGALLMLGTPRVCQPSLTEVSEALSSHGSRSFTVSYTGGVVTAEFTLPEGDGGNEVSARLRPVSAHQLQVLHGWAAHTGGMDSSMVATVLELSPVLAALVAHAVAYGQARSYTEDVPSVIAALEADGLGALRADELDVLVRVLSVQDFAADPFDLIAGARAVCAAAGA